MRLTTMIIAAALALSACGTVEADKGRAIVEAHGYSDVRITGETAYPHPGCPISNAVGASRFDATAPNGRRVKGYICNPWLSSEGYSLAIEAE